MITPRYSSEPAPENPDKIPLHPKVAVITCSVLESEIRYFARSLAQVREVIVLEYGLHGAPDRLRKTLQDTVQRVEDTTDCAVIVLGYGLCSRGTEGVTTRRCRLVIPRAHDCITLLLGSRARYARYVAAHPGTYWYSCGWNKCHQPPGKERYEEIYRRYLEKYGADNAEFLMETEQSWMKEYTRATFVDVGVAATSRDVTFTQACAEWLGWAFDHQHGDPQLLQSLLGGPWDRDTFCLLEPGQTIRVTADERVIEPQTTTPGLPIPYLSETTTSPAPSGYH